MTIPLYTYVLSDEDHPSTAVMFRPGNYPEAVKFGDRERTSDDFQYDDPPEWWGPSFAGGLFIAKPHWASSDAWRGHTNFTVSPGWVAVASGWQTGYPDDSVAHKMTAVDVYNAMIDGETPDFPVVWLFGVTSNIFSMTTDVYVPEANTGDWERFLETLGTNSEDFDNAFT